MDTSKVDLVGKTGLSVRDVFNISSSRLFGIYALDVENNEIIVLKATPEAETFFSQPEINWDDNIENVVKSFIAPQYRIALESIFSRNSVRSKFNSMEQHQEIVVERTDGRWNNISIIPLRVENGECKSALCTFVDITAVKKRSAEMEARMAAVKPSFQGMTKLFQLFAKENFEQIVKLDIDSGETSLLKFEGGEFSEVSLPRWNDFFERNFYGIHPADKDMVSQIFSVQNIKKMIPGDKKSCIYRGKVRSEKYSWYRTSLYLLEEEPSTVFALTFKAGDEIKNTFDVMKNLVREE